MSYLRDINSDWPVVPLSEVVESSEYGLSVPSTATGDTPMLKMNSLLDGKVMLTDLDRITCSPKDRVRYSIRAGDILFNRTNSFALVGKTAVVKEDAEVVFASYLVRFRVFKNVDPRFVGHWLNSIGAQSRMKELATPGVSQSNINPTRLQSDLHLPLPAYSEQCKISDILTLWDEAIEKLDALIAAKSSGKQALQQQLFTGKRRLKGFDKSGGKTSIDRFAVYPSDWRSVKLGSVTKEIPTRNVSAGKFPVLSCTKHHGLVLSEEYFSRKIYADDTSNYRVVKRGEFAYATNHIEEGSIGYQDLCEAGLVSPIYTVFKTSHEVDDKYLFRVLKSPLLIHLYRVNTSASVDRRGSLRYDEFANIEIWLPSKPEQIAIATFFDVLDKELNLLQTQRSLLDQQKRALMQKLLTGKIRVSA